MYDLDDPKLKKGLLAVRGASYLMPYPDGELLREALTLIDFAREEHARLLTSKRVWERTAIRLADQINASAVGQVREMTASHAGPYLVFHEWNCPAAEGTDPETGKRMPVPGPFVTYTFAVSERPPDDLERYEVETLQYLRILPAKADPGKN